MGYTNRINWEPLRSVDSATFTGVYVRVGSATLNPSYIMKMVNNSNVLVTISIDGVTDVDVLPPNSFWLYDENTSGSPQPEAFPKNTQIFVKGPAGIGLIYLVTIFQVAD